MKQLDEREYIPANIYRLCLDQVDDTLFKGCVYSLVSERILYFKTFQDFVLQLDQFMDEKGTPQSFQMKRSLMDNQISVPTYNEIPHMIRSLEDLSEKHGILATFNICVNSRCHTNWQGIVFSDEDFIGDFMDILELVKLLSL